MSYIILDLDGCISDDAWRIPLIDWRAGDPFARYHAYHSASPRDAAGPLAESELVKEFGVIIFTARPVFYRALTERWLREVAHIAPHAILMRNDADARPSVQVKADQLRQLFRPQQCVRPPRTARHRLGAGRSGGHCRDVPRRGHPRPSVQAARRLRLHKPPHRS